MFKSEIIKETLLKVFEMDKKKSVAEFPSRKGIKQTRNCLPNVINNNDNLNISIATSDPQ